MNPIGEIGRLVSESTPKDRLEYLQERKVRYVVFGKDHVDMAMHWNGWVQNSRLNG